MKTKIILVLYFAITTTSLSAQKALHFSELQKQLPNTEIAGYKISGEKEGATVKMGASSYSSAEAYYEKGSSELHITILDYAQAHNIFIAQTGMWQQGLSIDTTDEWAAPIEIEGIKCWAVLQKKEEKAELLLGIHNRYIVSLTTSAVNDIEVVKNIAKQLNLLSLPR